MSASSNPNGRSAAEIERDVERSRARVTDTIEELRSRVSPGQIMDQVVDYAKTSGGAEFMRNLGGSVRDNPLPILLIGAGIGWLMLSRSSDRVAPQDPAVRRVLPPPESDYLPEYDENGFGERGQFGDTPPQSSNTPGLGERVGRGVAATRDGAVRAAAGATEAISDAASQARATATGLAGRTAAAAGGIAGKASDLAEGVSRAGGGAAQQVRMRYHDARNAVAGAAQTAKSNWTSMVEERPLLIGALGLAAGAALAALLPRTAAEDRVMGEVSDATLGEVKDAAGKGYSKLSDAVGEQVEEVKEAMADAYADAKDRLDRDGVSAAGQVAADTVGQVAAASTEAVHAVSDKAKSALGGTDAAVDPAEDDAAKKPRGSGPAEAAGRP
jgi:ElaB/YqjD/DUF883 family membrane-anchored ribosome-binding protein